MAVEIQDCFDPLTPGQIVSFESDLGAELPDQYRRFLLSHNGGFFADDIKGEKGTFYFLGRKWENQNVPFFPSLFEHVSNLPGLGSHDGGPALGLSRPTSLSILACLASTRGEAQQSP